MDDSSVFGITILIIVMLFTVGIEFYRRYLWSTKFFHELLEELKLENTDIEMDNQDADID